MKRVERTFPLPYYVINKNYKIESYSIEAEALFGEPANLLEIIDEESHMKVKEWLTPEIKKSSIEVNLKSIDSDSDLITADIVGNWENDLYAEVILLVKDERLTKVTSKLQNLRLRLNDTNFELLEEKEKLEEAINQNNLLSAPFIVLNETTALVPLFGDLTREKMETVDSELLHLAQHSDADRILFDFTAVGELTFEGVDVLINVIKSLIYMGSNVSFIGVQPGQARRLNELHLPREVNYLHSLQHALRKYH